jgi:hypothetical protein
MTPETPAERRRRRLSELAALAVLVALVAINAFWFDAAGESYFEWFLANGSLIALLFGVVSATVDLDDNPSLIAADPLNFAIGVVRVFLELSTSLAALFGAPRSSAALEAAGLSELQTRFRWPLLDIVLAYAFLAVFALAMFAWSLVVAPLQYWVNLVCGAPARTALASGRTVWRVRRSERHTEYVIAPKDESELSAGDARDLEEKRAGKLASEISFATRPVTLTAGIAAAALLGVSQFV